MDMIPADISRKIYELAVHARSEDNKRKIIATIWHVLHFIQSSTVLYDKIPLFEGCPTHLILSLFNVDKIQQPIGLVTTRMIFYINDDEFEVTYNDYKDDAEVCMYVANKHGRYADVAADAFWACFPDGTVY
jgi:hypothetical protein